MTNGENQLQRERQDRMSEFQSLELTPVQEMRIVNGWIAAMIGLSKNFDEHPPEAARHMGSAIGRVYQVLYNYRQYVDSQSLKNSKVKPLCDCGAKSSTIDRYGRPICRLCLDTLEGFEKLVNKSQL
ncbi:MAG: hypothetical protein ACC642_00065 [Pseudomonadales bacterium]